MPLPRSFVSAGVVAGTLAACVVGVVMPRAAGAQRVIERAVPFDSAGRVLVLTPALARRLALPLAALGVTEPFLEARLFASGDALTLSVQRPDGIVERVSLDAAARAVLTTAVAQGLVGVGGRLRGDTALVISEPAGRAFVRNQTTLGFTVYGPAAAALVEDGGGATLAYAAALTSSFAFSLGASKEQLITRAQNRLSTSMALGFGAAGVGVASLIDPDAGRGYAAAVLGGSVIGTLVGLRAAEGMTDAEAAASATGASLATLATAGLVGVAGLYDESDERRAAVIPGLAALAAGYPLGPRYAGRRGYTVTAGDVRTLWPAALTGAGLAYALTYGLDEDRAVFATTTAGLLAGTFVGDRLLVRRRDHTDSEAGLISLGTLVGAGLGAAVASAADVKDRDVGLAAAIGAAAGLAFSDGVLAPAPDGGARRLRVGDASGPAVRWSPANLAFAAALRRGRFPLAQLSF
jgi:hypothetical protein